MPAAPIVDVHGIALRRPGALILRDVTLRVDPGEAVGLFGANGSGKTSLLRVLATLDPPSAGSGTVLGAPLGSATVEAVRPRIALVAHEAALRDNLTLEENLQMVAALSGRGDEDAAAALVAVGLGGARDRRAAVCSNGMRRRAEFARVALIAPDLLLLDEAHVGLDPAAGVLVEQMVERTTSRGGSVLLVSHERDRVRTLIRRSVTLADGRLEESS
ncbi:MAG TPA: ATP-binding cassette domain-containing protein [Acidimicrobiia bacterium]|nr:ATP-binding cassette domain-containing protein [Acidimicrobiia bacterium]